MNNRFNTSFLRAFANFWTGFGSIFNLGGHPCEYDFSDDADARAIANDWRMIGQDIADSLHRTKTNLADPRE